MSRATRHVASIRTASKNKAYSIIIPAAGMGNRMRTYGVKSLIQIGSETIIERQLRIIKKTFKKYEIILVTGFESDKLMNKTPDNIIKVENTSYEETNVIRSIGMGLRATNNDRVIIIYGDLVFTPNLLKAPFDMDSLLLLDNKGLMKSDEIGCSVRNGYLEHMTYVQPQKWAQVAYYTGKELDLLRRISYSKNNNMMFGFEAINKIVNSGGSFKTYSPVRSKVIDIDNSKDLQMVKEVI